MNGLLKSVIHSNVPNIIKILTDDFVPSNFVAIFLKNFEFNRQKCWAKVSSRTRNLGQNKSGVKRIIKIWNFSPAVTAAVAAIHAAKAICRKEIGIRFFPQSYTCQRKICGIMAFVQINKFSSSLTNHETGINNLASSSY